MQQIKNLQSLVDKFNQKCTAEMKECDMQRHAYLTQIGNILHPSVPISGTEVRTFSPIILRLRGKINRNIIV